MAPHRPPTETRPLGYTEPRAPRQTQATHHPPGASRRRIWTISGVTSLGRRLTLPILEFGTPPLGPHSRHPTDEPLRRYSRHRIQHRIHIHYIQPPMMAPINGQILLGGSEKKVSFDSGGEECETRPHLPLSPLSSVLIPTGWPPRRRGLLDGRNMADWVSGLAKRLSCWSLEESRYIDRHGGASDQSVTMNRSPSGIDHVRDFGDTKMALLGSRLVCSSWGRLGI